MDGSRRHQKLVRKMASTGGITPAVAAAVGVGGEDDGGCGADPVLSHRPARHTSEEADDSGCSVCNSSPEPSDCKEGENGRASPSSCPSDGDSLGSERQFAEDECNAFSDESPKAMGETASCSCQSPCLCQPFQRAAHAPVPRQQTGHTAFTGNGAPTALVDASAMRTVASDSGLGSSGSSSASRVSTPLAEIPDPFASARTALCQGRDAKLVTAAAETYEGRGETENHATVERSRVVQRHLALSAQRSLPAGVIRNIMIRKVAGSVAEMSSDSDEELERQDQIVDLIGRQETRLREKAEVAERDRALAEDRTRKLQDKLSEAVHQIHALEDRMKENEMKVQDEKRAEELKSRVKLSQAERKLTQQVDMVRLLLKQSEDAQATLRESESSLRDQLRVAKEQSVVQEEASLQLKRRHESIDLELSTCQEQHRREAERSRKAIAHLKEQVACVTKQATSWESQYNNVGLRANTSISKSDELEAQLHEVKKTLKEESRKNEELCSLLVLQGKALMMEGEGENPSLAAELETKSKDDLMTSLREEENHSQRLNQYVSSLLGIVMERCPELLEVPPSGAN